MDLILHWVNFYYRYFASIKLDRNTLLQTLIFADYQILLAVHELHIIGIRFVTQYITTLIYGKHLQGPCPHDRLILV